MTTDPPEPSKSTDLLGSDTSRPTEVGIAGTPPAPRAVPERIGPYRIVSRLGAGGLGEVFLAVREDGAITRRVAIKLIRPALESDDLIRRFDQERRILVGLEHPNIARLIDAGRTELGRPYFVMEYVEGRPIDQHCDDRRLSTEDRLRIFVKVCGAVAHAHRNLVVHRDIKPDNILVTAEGEPKLLDFGIAKLLNPDLAGSPVVTIFDHQPMTPEYASPEQIRGLPISTASDVYALGVLLYELLTGRRPFRLPSRVREEVARIICEVEPERPSTAVMRDAEKRDRTGTISRLTPDEVARRHGAGTSRLRRQLEGDLDNIVLKALRKQADARYPSAGDLADDVVRHLDGLPIKARPDRWYVLARLSRRYAPYLATAAIALGTLGAGLMVALAQRDRARQAEAAAVSAQQSAENRLAQIEGVARRLLELQGPLARAPGTAAARADVLTVAATSLKEVMAAGVDSAPVVQALAEAYRQLGEVADGLPSAAGSVQRSREFLAQELELRRQQFQADQDNPATRAPLALSMVAVARQARRMGDHPASASLLAEAETLLSPVARGESKDPQLRWAYARLLSDQAFELDDEAQTRERLKRSLDIRRQLQAEAPADANTVMRVAVGVQDLAELDLDQGRLSEAESGYAQVVEIRRKIVSLLPDDPAPRRQLHTALTTLGEILLKQGRTAPAGELSREALVIASEFLERAPESREAWQTLRGSYLLAGELQRKLGNVEAADAFFRVQLDRAAKLHAADPGIASRRYDLALAQAARADTLKELGRTDAAISTARDARDNFREIASPSRPDAREAAASAGLLLGRLLLSRPDRSADAMIALSGALDDYAVLASSAASASESVLLAAGEVRVLMAEQLIAAGKPEQAVPLLSDAVDTLPESSEQLPEALARLATVQEKLGKLEVADRLRERALDAIDRAVNPSSRLQSLRTELKAQVHRR